MTLVRRISSVTFVLAIGLALGPIDHAAASNDDDGGCAKVKGKFEAANVPPPACTSPLGFCTEGTLKGNFKGNYSFVMSEAIPANEPDAPALTFFKGTSVVTTASGDELIGIDAGAINLEAPGMLNSGRFSTLLTFTSGAAGHLWIHGTADLAGGTVSGSYSGFVCSE